MGQKGCPLKLGGHHGLRRRSREGVFAGPLHIKFDLLHLLPFTTFALTLGSLVLKADYSSLTADRAQR